MMAEENSHPWGHQMTRLLSQTSQAVSWIFVFKAAIGCSVSALALFGVTVPQFGIETTPIGELAAALGGGILGTLIALKG